MADDTLIYCSVCNTCFVNNFRTCDTNILDIEEYLEKNKTEIFSDYIDIEKNSYYYYKYCPICKKVNSFYEV